MRFLRDMFKPKEPEQKKKDARSDVRKRVPDIGRTTPPPDGTHRDEIIVTSNQPLLEQNSKVIDNIIAEVHPKVTKR